MKENRPVILVLAVAVALLAGLAPAQAQAAFGVEHRFEAVRPAGVSAFAGADLAVDADGSIYVLWPGVVQKYAPAGTLLTSWGGYGSAPGQFFPPDGYGRSTTAIEVDGRGHVYVADYEGNRVVKFTTGGAFVANWGANGGDGTAGRGPGEFDGPADLVADAAGNLIVSESPHFSPSAPTHAQIQRISPEGVVLAVRAGHLREPAAGPGDRVYFAAGAAGPEGGDAISWYEGADLGTFGNFSLAFGDLPDDRGHFGISCCGTAFVRGRLWVARNVIGALEAYGPQGGLLAYCPAGAAQRLAAGRDGRLYVLTDAGAVLRYGDAAAAPCDTTPPAIDHLTLSARVLRVSRYRRLRGASISFSTSEQGIGALSFTRLVDGRRLRGRCVKATERNRRRPRCVRRRVDEGSFGPIRASVTDGAFARFVDLLWRRRPPAGRYELRLVVTDRSGLRSQPAVTRVRVTR